MNFSNTEHGEYLGGSGSNASEIARLDTLSKHVEQMTQKALTIGGINGCHSILDLGCGPGNISIPLAKAFPAAHVYGVDRSNSFIEEARRRTEDKQLVNLSFYTADAQCLPFEEECFDFVIIRFLLQHVRNVAEVLKEVDRVCKPGAKIVIIEADWGGQLLYPEPADPYLLIKELPDLLLLNGTDVHMGRKVPSYVTEAGFYVTTVYSDMMVFYGENLQSFTDSLLSRLQIMEQTMARQTQSVREGMSELTKNFPKFLALPIH